jgi:hypothetical protein
MNHFPDQTQDWKEWWDKQPTYSYPKCVHDATKPVYIGGYPVYLGAQRDIPKEVSEVMDLVCPLNGYLPKVGFGRLVPIICCELPDRGGVPQRWASFIHGVAGAIRKGRKVLAYCTGSHGRTGVFGASLISVMEPDEPDPIAAIRERHCYFAVESLAQAEAVFALRGLPLPEEYKDEFKPVVYEYKGGYTSGNSTIVTPPAKTLKEIVVESAAKPEPQKEEQVFTGTAFPPALPEAEVKSKSVPDDGIPFEDEPLDPFSGM